MKNKINEKPWPVQPRWEEEKKRVSASSSAETKRKYKRETHRHASTRLPVMEWESSERDKPLACSARVCDRRLTVRPTDCFTVRPCPEWWWWNLYLTSLPYRGWWATAGYIGLVLVYNALGLMSNNVSLHVYTWEVVLCTGSSMYICPNSLLYRVAQKK